jgi:hypothetical protein
LPITLVTVPNVPILSTGTYQLASGETTFTAEMLADAVQAAQDATIVSPRLKLGHSDPRFDDAVASGELGGEPAFGTVENLRLSEDGQTVIGDYANVPEWLADSLPSSYPGRSIEGGFRFTAASGRTYQLVITACALLGVTWPGVTSLADLQEVLEQNGQVPEVLDADGGAMQDGVAEAFVVARLERPGARAPRQTQVVAGIDIGAARMAFMADLDSGDVPQAPDGDGIGPQAWWWPRSIRVDDDGSLSFIIDDDEGHVLQLPFTVSGQDLSYGDPTPVVVQYVPVAAAAAGPRDVVLGRPIRAASRPNPHPEVSTVRLNGVEVDAAPYRRAFGLADDATDEQIYEAMGVTAEPAPPEPTPPAATLPEGTVVIEQDVLDELRQGAQTAQALAASAGARERDDAVTAAITAGRIPGGSRERWVTRWDQDADGTRTLLTAAEAEGGLAAGLIPVGRREVGRSGDGDGQPQDAQHDAFMAQHFPSNRNRLRDKQGVRVHQEA